MKCEKCDRPADGIFDVPYFGRLFALCARCVELTIANFGEVKLVKPLEADGGR